MQFNAQIGGAAEAAAEVVPGQAALEGVGTTAGRRLPVDDAALVVLGQVAGGLLKYRRGGVAPAFDAAGVVEVVEEIRFESQAVGELAGDVDDVVFQRFEEVGRGDLGGTEAGAGAASGCGRQKGKRRKDEEGYEETGL
jgi:hypothetical protein